MVIMIIRSISQTQVTENPIQTGYTIRPALYQSSLSSQLNFSLCEVGMLFCKPYFTDSPASWIRRQEKRRRISFLSFSSWECLSNRSKQWDPLPNSFWHTQHPLTVPLQRDWSPSKATHASLSTGPVFSGITATSVGRCEHPSNPSPSPGV